MNRKPTTVFITIDSEIGTIVREEKVFGTKPVGYTEQVSTWNPL